MANIGSCMGDGINKCDYCEFRDLCKIRVVTDTTDNIDPCKDCDGIVGGAHDAQYRDFLRWNSKM